MCVEPCNLPSGEMVACRYCWQCRANRVNDLVGRCIAEQSNSTATLAATLTYAGDGPETAMLRYSDFQKSIKLLRRHGFAPRYIVAGEFGTKKGRAHWHAVLFFNAVWINSKTGAYGPARVPVIGGTGEWDVILNRNIHWKPWPHGFAFFQAPDYGGFAYVLKYALKDQDADVSKGHLAMSKKPPLGDEFFTQLAAMHIEQGLAPQDLFYSFPHVFDAKRKRRRFLIQGTSRKNYLNRFIEGWEAAYGTAPPISDELVAHWDKLAAQELAGMKTDAEFLAAKTQWPKYTTPDKTHGGAEWLREMSYQDPDAWLEVEGVPPSDLWDDMPLDAVALAADGETLRLRVWLEADGMTFYTDGTERMMTWHANAERAPMWREWIEAARNRPAVTSW